MVQDDTILGHGQRCQEEGAILLERATPPREPTPWPVYSEGKEAQHELLRQKEGEPDHTIEPKA